MSMENIASPQEVSHKINVKVPVEWLCLDKSNPRLVGVGQNVSDERIISQLYRSEELGELIQSIASNGYLDIEPLIVCLENGNDNKFTVLEGNRRLAAIRLFREPSLATAINEKERIKITIPELSDDFKHTLDKVSVYHVPDREAARSFIGFKHINGAAKWESYAKAKFAADWYRSGSITMEQIAEKIGDKHDTIKRMVWAIYVLEQAENDGVFSLANRNTPKFNFSHLYTALSRSQYMEHLGLNPSWVKQEPSENPIPKEKLDELREILIWIYGSKEDSKSPVVLSQNPDIKRLGEVLCSMEGLHVLRAGGNLDEAHISTQPADEKLSSGLLKARALLRESANNLRGYDGKDQALLNVAEDISETASTIYDRMQKKYKDAVGK